MGQWTELDRHTVGSHLHLQGHRLQSGVLVEARPRPTISPEIVSFLVIIIILIAEFAPLTPPTVFTLHRRVIYRIVRIVPDRWAITVWKISPNRSRNIVIFAAKFSHRNEWGAVECGISKNEKSLHDLQTATTPSFSSRPTQILYQNVQLSLLPPDVFTAT